MEMKWKPIVNGDLSEVPRDEEFLFTVFDEEDGETYVTPAWIVEYEGEVEVREDMTGGLRVHEAKNVKAWMDYPEPYKPTPDNCFKCNHGHLQHDEDSDNWFECELLQRAVPPCDKPEDCPLNR